MITGIKKIDYTDFVLSAVAGFIWDVNREVIGQEDPQPPNPPPDPCPQYCGDNCCGDTTPLQCCGPQGTACCYNGCCCGANGGTCCHGECCSDMPCCAGQCCVKDTGETEPSPSGPMPVFSYECCKRASGEHCCDSECLKITSIDGPDKVCLGKSASFTAESNVEGKAPCFVKWVATNGNGTLNTGDGSTFTWSQPSTNWGQNVLVAACNCDPCSSCPNATKSVTIGFWTFSDYYQIAGCSDVIQNPGWVFWIDGCSGVLENPTGCLDTSFHDCCCAHDTHFQTCGYNMESANAEFGTCVHTVCWDLGGPAHSCFSACQTNAYIYSIMVNLVGIIPYQEDQRKVCACCNNDFF